RQQQDLLLTIPQRQREHAVEAEQSFLAPLGDRMEHHLGIAGRAELVASRLELNAQLTEIVDLAIVTQDIAGVRRQDWLMAGRTEVEDGQAAMAEREGAVDELALPVWAAVANGIGHSLQNDGRRRRAIKVQEACDPTHGLAPDCGPDPALLLRAPRH